MTDQKSRNTYKRLWRNRRNMNQHLADARASVQRAQHSLRLIQQDFSENKNIKEMDFSE